MANHDDFADDYIEYGFFEESIKDSGGDRPQKKNSGCGCLTIALIVCIAVAVIIMVCLFGS